MKKRLSKILIAVGTFLIFISIILFVFKSSNINLQNPQLTTSDWITLSVGAISLLAGLGGSVKDWRDLFKKEKQAPPITKMDFEGNDSQISLGEKSLNIKIDTLIVHQTPEQINSISAPLPTKEAGNIISVEDSKRKLIATSQKRYLDALDSARFIQSANIEIDEKENEEYVHSLKLLYAKAQFILALVFGDTIVITENQLFDSEGFVEAFDEFYKAAQEASIDIDLPVKVAILNEGESMYDVIAKKLSNEKFVLSLWRDLNRDIPRRKAWASSFRQKQSPTETNSTEEKIYLDKLLTALEYFTPERSLLAKRTGSMFGDLIKRIINLSDGYIEDLHTGLRPGLRIYFVHQEEADAAKEIRDVLGSIENKIKGIKDRSAIMSELENYDNKIKDELKDGVIALTNAVYNYTNGIGTKATLVQNSIFPRKTHKYTSAGSSLATYLHETSFSPNSLTLWEIYSIDFFDNLAVYDDPRKRSEFVALIKTAQRNAPWKKMIELQNHMAWLESLQNFRDTLLRLQSVQKKLSGLQDNNEDISSLESERNQLEKKLPDAWEKHIRNTTAATSNGFWEITSTKIVFRPQSDQGLEIHLSYSFLNTKLYMAHDKQYAPWLHQGSYKGYLGERIE